MLGLMKNMFWQSHCFFHNVHHYLMVCQIVVKSCDSGVIFRYWVSCSFFPPPTCVHERGKQMLYDISTTGHVSIVHATKIFLTCLFGPFNHWSIDPINVIMDCPSPGLEILFTLSLQIRLLKDAKGDQGNYIRIVALVLVLEHSVELVTALRYMA